MKLVILLIILIFIAAIVGFVVHKRIARKNQTPWYMKTPELTIKAVCISLDYRLDKFEIIRKCLQRQKIALNWSPGIVGKQMNVQECPDKFITERLRNHFCKNPQHLGHFGALLAHQKVWMDVKDFYRGPTLILEDDAVVDPKTAQRVKENIQKISEVDPDWDVLICGFSCGYDSYDKCHKNDGVQEICPGIVPLKYFIGLWGYVIKGPRSAEKMFESIYPFDWMVDHHLNNLIEKGTLKVYGCVPNIVMHPGTYECSSWNYTSTNRADKYFSDTNN